jgi:hypothetical protein
MTCQICNVRAQTEFVEFRQNIGLLYVRFTRTYAGEFCAACIRSTFWRSTLITLVAGWWGVISLVMTPVILVHNIAQFWRVRELPRGLGPRSQAGMAPPPEAHPTLSLTPEALQRLAPLENELRTRLVAGEAREDVLDSIARKAGVSGVQAELFADRLTKRADALVV